jgi:hypothetical protein
VKDKEIKKRWRDYFDWLFNDENGITMPELDDSFVDANMLFVWRIQKLEVKEALKRMKGGKTLVSVIQKLEIKEALKRMKGGKTLASVEMPWRHGNCWHVCVHT